MSLYCDGVIIAQVFLRFLDKLVFCVQVFLRNTHRNLGSILQLSGIISHILSFFSEQQPFYFLSNTSISKQNFPYNSPLKCILFLFISNSKLK